MKKENVEHMIRVSELIELLGQFDQNLPVVTPGFDESPLEHIRQPMMVHPNKYDRLTGTVIVINFSNKSNALYER